MMDFIEILKQKAFKRYSVNAYDNKEGNGYEIASEYQGNLNEDFFHHLSENLSLPNEQKYLTFSFKRNDFKGFKNACLQSIIKHNPSLEEFDNYFHSFYKNISLNDLLNATYVKSDSYGKPIKNSVYQPYILYFLKQSFHHQSLYPNDFIQALHFNFHVTKDNYPDLKESLFTFLSQHAHFVKDKIRNGSTYANNIDKQVKDFENSMYDSIARFIKPEDMKMFNSFWPRILIKSNNENMITKVDNTFVFDLNFAYLSDTYPQITNESIAQKTCHFINNVINNDLHEFLTSAILFEESTYARFYIHFQKSLNKDSIPDIFDKCIELKVKSNQFEDHFVKSEYREVYNEMLALLKKEVIYMDLKSQLPAKNVSEKKLKI